MQVEQENLSKQYEDGEELKGLFHRIPNGYAVVIQNLRGDLNTKGAGLRFFYPWDKKYIYYLNNVSINFKKENYKSKDGYEIIVDTAVTYEKEDSIKFHMQKNGIQQLKLLIDEILRIYISQHTFEEVATWTLDVKTTKKNSTGPQQPGAYDDLEYYNPITESNDLNKEIDKKLHNEILRKINDFSDVYGISINNIIIQKAELTEELKRSKEEDELTKARNKRMVATAQAELETAKKKAEATKAQGEADAKILEKKLKAISSMVGDAKSSDVLKLLRDYLIGNNASYTVIENATGDDFYTKANVVANAFGKNNTLSNLVNNNNITADECEKTSGADSTSGKRNIFEGKTKVKK